MKGVMRFGKKGNLSSRYVDQYQIMKRIGKVAYELDFPNELALIHSILDRQVKRLRNKEKASVNVLWRNHLVEGATFEVEADNKSQYPHLFPSTTIQD
ncbi:hypothetical protein MTR67_043651 [Solanum verrucosum]|uniref:Tf2-1-like SH3-like domain-containing protein n=1 Tax=Solanum verrucosum TaxID=315347 RepID=A0AAF0ZSV9_SOLVR|nr:hypothetical protein MTR67_043651 [Solanum verrucosum]